MDPIDILGSLLGGGSKSANSGGGLGGKILSELLKGGRGKGASTPVPKTTTPTPTSINTTGGSRTGSSRSSSLEQQAEELEAMLGVAQDRRAPRPSGSTTEANVRQAPRSEYRPAPAPTIHQRSSTSSTTAPTRTSNSTTATREHAPSNPIELGAGISMTQEDEAVVLIRAMVNAAKADGRVTPTEQQKVFEQLANPTQAAMDFLRSEFAAPLDVREFAWSVPLGMEVQVYSLSLATMELDTNPEADYLRKLAHGLRLTPDVCNQIHLRYGAPTLF